MNIELTLEIEDGCKYNNLVNEIEYDFVKYKNEAYRNYVDGNYEKTIQYYKKCLQIDPDNKLIKTIHQKYKNILNLYIKRILDCAYYSFYENKYELSRYYFTKTYFLIEDNSEYIIKKNYSYLEDIIRYLRFINNKIDYRIKNISTNDLYDIQIIM